MELLLVILVAASAFGNVLREPLPICPDNDTGESIYFPSYENCKQFYQCSNGVPLLQDCPGGLYFDATLNVCNWAESEDAANCAGKPTGTPTLPSTESQTTYQPRTTEARTTEARTTEARTTEVRTTEARTTEARTTEEGTTEVRTTKSQTTEATEGTTARLPEWNSFCHSDGCFQYLLIPTAMIFTTARDTCLSLGADLVSIRNAQENTYVKNMTPFNIWIGLNDIKIEGRYEWSDGSTYQYSSWSMDQPSDYNHSRNCVVTEDCVSGGCFATNNWWDVDCNRNSYWSVPIYTVCKK